MDSSCNLFYILLLSFHIYTYKTYSYVVTTLSEGRYATTETTLLAYLS